MHSSEAQHYRAPAATPTPKESSRLEGVVNRASFIEHEITRLNDIAQMVLTHLIGPVPLKPGPSGEVARLSSSAGHFARLDEIGESIQARLVELENILGQLNNLTR